MWVYLKNKCNRLVTTKNSHILPTLHNLAACSHCFEAVATGNLSLSPKLIWRTRKGWTYFLQISNQRKRKQCTLRKWQWHMRSTRNKGHKSVLSKLEKNHKIFKTSFWIFNTPFIIVGWYIKVLTDERGAGLFVHAETWHICRGSSFSSFLCAWMKLVERWFLQPVLIAIFRWNFFVKRCYWCCKSICRVCRSDSAWK